METSISSLAQDRAPEHSTEKHVCQKPNRGYNCINDDEKCMNITGPTPQTESIIHIPTKEDTMTLQLSKQNMTMAVLPNREKLLTLFDSGARNH